VTQLVRISYFSDALCVWAYVAQIRCDELLVQFPGRVSIENRFIQVFGNVRAKMETQWRDRGGIQAYAAHVSAIVDGFEHVSAHPQVWLSNTPESSMPTHLFLCAVRVLEEGGELEPGTLARALWTLREAFFTECAPLSDRATLLGLGERIGISNAPVERLLDNGRAHAALSEDLDFTRDQSIRASPTMILNEDRQRLTGNVGYRVIEANVRELLDSPDNQQSWC